MPLTFPASPLHAGTPVQRPLFLDFEDDPLTHDVEYQYMFGPDLVVAPILYKGVVRLLRSILLILLPIIILLTQIPSILLLILLIHDGSITPLDIRIFSRKCKVRPTKMRFNR